MSHVDKLNAAQREAVLQTEGPLLVLAGAGAGKTRVIAHRILEIVRRGTAPEHVLAITFTNKAAKEMRERVTTLLQESPEITLPAFTPERMPFVSTFHSLGLRLIKENYRLLGFARFPAIYDRSDSLKIVKQAMKDLDVGDELEPRTVLSVASRNKGDGVTPDLFIERAKVPRDRAIGEVWARYERALAQDNALDFDDLLARALYLLREHADLRAHYQSRWQFIHIDEYQDTNVIQSEMAALLVNPVTNNICCVGDMDQCVVAGTKIAMADGTVRPIEQIKKDDAVLSCYGSGDLRPARVSQALTRTHAGEVIRITTRAGHVVESTPEHTHFAGDPHHRAQSKNGNRRNITLTLCGDRRGATPMHRISIVGNDVAGRKALESLGLSVRRAKEGSDSWRFETARGDWGELQEIAARIMTVWPEAQVIANARLGGEKVNPKDGNSLGMLPAASVLPGMVMFDEKGRYDIVEKAERVPAGKQKVYDLNIEPTHNFIANGLLTHNCIYGWRGADIKNIMSFEKQYPGAKVVLLEENYRSTKTIIAAANRLISKNQFRMEKNLFTSNEDGEPISFFRAFNESDEARFVARKVRELVKEGAQPRDFAVLYRANFQSRALEEAFLQGDVAYQVLGTRFFDRAEIKDTLSYLRAALSGASADVARAAVSPRRGIGKTALLAMVANREGELRGAGQAAVAGFRALLERIAGAFEELSPSQLVSFVIRESGLEQEWKEDKAEGQERLENVRELVALARRYDTMPKPDGLHAFLEGASLSSDQDEMEDDQNAVRLMTVHASKGLEFPTVFITGLEEGLFPYEREGDKDKEKEEERRLMYVAITRARRKLFLTLASMRTVFGAQSFSAPSQFLGDIPGSLVKEEESERLGRTIYLG